MSTIEPERWVAQLIGAACCVVGARPDVKSITVVTSRRPGFDELAELRAHAASCNADFSAGDLGSIVVRRRFEPAADSPLESGLIASDPSPF
jgi:hypothetical protein